MIRNDHGQVYQRVCKDQDDAAPLYWISTVLARGSLNSAMINRDLLSIYSITNSTQTTLIRSSSSNPAYGCSYSLSEKWQLSWSKHSYFICNYMIAEHSIHDSKIIDENNVVETLVITTKVRLQMLT